MTPRRLHVETAAADEVRLLRPHVYTSMTHIQVPVFGWVCVRVFTGRVCLLFAL